MSHTRACFSLPAGGMQQAAKGCRASSRARAPARQRAERAKRAGGRACATGAILPDAAALLPPGRRRRRAAAAAPAEAAWQGPLRSRPPGSVSGGVSASACASACAGPSPGNNGAAAAASSFAWALACARHGLPAGARWRAGAGRAGQRPGRRAAAADRERAARDGHPRRGHRHRGAVAAPQARLPAAQRSCACRHWRAVRRPLPAPVLRNGVPAAHAVGNALL